MSSSRASRSRIHHRWVVIAGCLATATLVALVPVVWRRIDEERCLVLLQSPRLDEQASAARRLGELRSARAVPRLIEIALAEQPERFRSWEWRGSPATQALLAIGRPAVAPLLEKIKRSDWSYGGREHAILSALGREAMGPLLDATRSPEDRMRAYAVGQLGRFVGSDPAAFDRVALLLTDGADSVRQAAVGSMSEAATRPEEAAALLRARLEDPAEDTGIRRGTAYVLPDLGPAGVQTLRSALAHADPLVRVHAAASLMRSVPELEGEALPVLLSSLRVEHDEARRVALSELSETPHLSVEALAGFLGDTSGEVRSAAARALQRRRRVPESALPDMLRILRDRPAHGWVQAIDLLGELGSAAHEAVPDLVQVVNAGKEEAHYSALCALQRIDSVPRSLVPALIKALAVGLSCNVAAEALGRLGPDAGAAVPALIAAFGTDGCSGDLIVQALGRIGSPAVPGLIAALHQESDGKPYWALRALAAIGPLAREATAPLMEIVRKVEEDNDPVALAARALGRIGPEAREAAPLLVGLLRVDFSDAEDVGIAAAPEALGRMGPSARSATPFLLEAAGSSRESTRAAAVLTLGRLQAEGEAVLAAVRRGVADDQPIVRACAVLALTHLRADGVESGKALSSAFKDPDFRWLPFLNAMEGYPDELKTALPALLAAIDDETLSWWEHVLKACDLIGTLGAEAGPAAPVLERLIDRLRESEIHERILEGCGPARAAAERALRRIRQATAR